MIACGVSIKEIQEWLGHSAISTTADIYSHLNYSSKLNVASTLTNVFGGGTLDVKAQNTSEAQALLSTLFRGAEHEQATQTMPMKVEEIIPTDDNDEHPEQIVAAQIIPPESDSIAEYKKAKSEMARLGFETLDEYFDYMEFMKVKAKRNCATT